MSFTIFSIFMTIVTVVLGCWLYFDIKRLERRYKKMQEIQDELDQLRKERIAKKLAEEQERMQHVES